MAGKRKLGLPENRPIPAGVPLGGIGCGSFEMGIDGRMRNITINNNRSSEERIREVPGSFLAVRSLVKGKVATRILQSSSGLPWADAGIDPPLCAPEKLTWRGLYPASKYKLDDGGFPLGVSWRAMAPIVPFDLDASTTPAVLFYVTIENPTDQYVDASVLFNWENLSGCTQLHRPDERGHISIIRLAQDGGEGGAPTQVTGGLEFGKFDEFEGNADGNYCLAPRVGEGAAHTAMSWDGSSAADLEELWNRFTYEGDLQDTVSNQPEHHQGALCSTRKLEPKSNCTFVFVLSWFCPRYVANGTDMSNAYVNRFANAREVAGKALHHAKYFGRAVANLQQRLTNSSLPRWLPRMLLNSMHVLSTNSIYTRDGRFAMMETPAMPLLGCADRRLYSSIGTLLFYPELELKECSELLEAQQPEKNQKLTRYLGHKGFGAVQSEGPQPQADLGAALVIMAYRNYMMTGHAVTLNHTFPRIKAIMEHISKTYVNNDGLVELNNGRNTFEDWTIHGADSYTNSLWIAAIRAFMHLAQDSGDGDAVTWATNLLRVALNGFEKKLWVAQPPYYRHSVGDKNHDGCHIGQLAGTAFTDLLFLGELCPNDHVRDAISTLRKFNGSKEGVVRGTMPDGSGWQTTEGESNSHPASAWPLMAQATFSALQIGRGYADHGLYDCKNFHEQVLVNGERMFNQPLRWDIPQKKSIGYGSDRHMASMSVWHVYHALLGFALDASKNTLWLTPNLPKNVHELNVPLFTPHCIGHLVYGVRYGDSYAQQVKFGFDSPVKISRVVLQVPDTLQAFNLTATNNGEPIQVEHFLGGDGRRTLVEVVPSSPQTVTEPLEIWIRT